MANRMSLINKYLKDIQLLELWLPEGVVSGLTRVERTLLSAAVEVDFVVGESWDLAWAHRPGMM